ncbi:MAG: 1-acyl-sn-glycerol-3-phosphate acyltransferase [bacterium]
MVNSIENMDTFTFIEGEVSWMERVSIRLVEDLSGKKEIAKRYQRVVDDQTPEKSFWQRAVEQLDLEILVNGLSPAEIPQGPLLIVANHPFGQVDGVVLSHLIETFRPDYRVVAWEILNASDQLADVVLPICFKEDYSAKRNNLATMRLTIDTLQQGKTVILFPAGMTSTSPTWFGTAVDPPWQKFLSKLILKTNPTILPVYFHGQNSRLFQIASHLNYHLKLSLFFYEMRRMIGQEILVSIGQPQQNLLEVFGRDESQINSHLYQSTMDLRQLRADPFHPFSADYYRQSQLPQDFEKVA